MEYDGIHFEHPHFKMINQHRALSLPYENAPFEVINHRWLKDMKRFDMLWELYPVTFNDKIQPTMSNISDIPDGVCLMGFTALSHIMHEAKKHKYAGIGCELEWGKTIGKTSLLSNNIDDVIVDLKLVDYKIYNEILDNIPQRIESDKYVIYDTYGLRISAHNAGRYYIANLQYLMSVFLYNDTPQDKWGYAICVSLIKFVENCDDTDLKKMILPSADVYGNVTVTKDYMYHRGIGKRPKNIYFTKADGNTVCALPDIDFEPSENILYKIDGKQTDELFTRNI